MDRPSTPAALPPESTAAVQALAMLLLGGIKAHYRRPDATPHGVYEALNALAGCVAVVLVGCERKGDAAPAHEFYRIALERNLAGTRLQFAEPAGHG